MTSICLRSVKNCTAYFLIVVMLLLSKALHCADNGDEVERQRKISAFLTANQNKKKQQKPEGLTQTLLEGYKEEAELKNDVVALPIGTLARAGVRQRKRNKTYTRGLKAALPTAFPQPVKKIVKDYARPELVLDAQLKYQDGRIYNFMVNESPIAMSYSDDGTKQDAAAWHKNTGAFVELVNNNFHYKSRPEQISGLSEIIGGGFTDSACSPDGQMLAATTFAGNDLYVWPSALPLMHAIAQGNKGQLLMLQNKKTSGQSNDEEPTDNPFTSVAFSPCSNYVFVGGADGVMHQIDAKTGESVYSSVDHGAAVTALEIPRGGDTVYAGLEDGRVCIWKGDLLPPPVTSLTTQGLGDDGPQAATMTDEAIHIVPLSGEYQSTMQNMMCLDDCLRCRKHGKKCCSLCAELGSVAAQCCRTGASCVIHCPRACAISCKTCSLFCSNQQCCGVCCRLCYYGGQRVCLRLGICCIQAIRRLWQ